MFKYYILVLIILVLALFGLVHYLGIDVADTNTNPVYNIVSEYSNHGLK